MPVRPFLAVLLAAALPLPACAGTAAAPPAGGAHRVDPVDPPAVSRHEAIQTQGDEVPATPHEVSLVADFGPLPDGSGDAVVEAVWTTAADGTVRFTIQTPAGLSEQHVATADEHWWWLGPEVRRTIADAEWVHFDLRAIERVGGDLPDVVVEARQPPPQPDDIAVGHVVAGREVLAVDVVGADEVHLTVTGVERPVVLRRRVLPAGATVEVPRDAVDAAELGDVLRW